MDSSKPLSLPIARLRLQFTVTSPIQMQDWIGSMLRGAFGHALRRTACMTREKECSTCPLFKTCPYPAIFAPPPLEHKIQNFSQPPAPYLIEPEAWGARRLESGETFSFTTVLMGRALNELPLVVYSWQSACEHGLGREREGKASLKQIEYILPSGETELIYNHEDQRLQTFTVEPLIAPVLDQCSNITLRFTSPLRLQENGHPIAEHRLTPNKFLMALIRRVGLICQLYGNGDPGWDYQALCGFSMEVTDEKTLHWRDWSRHSSRQQQKITLGGVVGTWKLIGDLQPFVPALFLGQWLHVGKETVFGLGWYDCGDTFAGVADFPERPLQVTDLIEESGVPQ